MAAEIVSLREAVERFVPDGCHLTVGGKGDEYVEKTKSKTDKEIEILAVL